MTITSKSNDICSQDLISAKNPQGLLPENNLLNEISEEQMEFTIDSLEIHNANETQIIEDTHQERLVLESVGESSVPLEDEIFQIDSIAAPLTITEPISLPAALCDDLLLQEINSIPDKMGFKIGDVADLLNIKQYVLRYWESEFEILKPKKANNNQRLYTKKNVENAFLIRKLLHRDRFSIEGARAALKGLKAYVKKESTKEKELLNAKNRLENFQESLENIAFDIRRIRQLFR